MSDVKRKLATIMATDCVGFSKHMTENEELTLENLKACRSIIDPLIIEQQTNQLTELNASL